MYRRTIACLAALLAFAATSFADRPVLQDRTPILERPWTTDAGKFSFVILGDKTGGGPEGWPTFDRAVAEINRLDPDFVVMVGDMVQGYMEDTSAVAAQWEEFWSHARALEVPLFFYPGNHDVSNPPMLELWKQRHGRRYYSFDYQGCHFLMLNTDEERDGGTGFFGDEQMEFALEDLAARPDARHTFVFMHKPAWIEPQYRETWGQIVEELGDRPHTVVAGHWHNLKYEERDGHTYLVHGATGAHLRESEVRETGAFYHYTLVTVNGDDVSMAIIEPGSIWPADIAPMSFAREARRLVNIVALPPEDLDAGRATAGYAAVLRNGLPDTATVDITATLPQGWSTAEPGGETLRETLAPGAERTVERRFTVADGDLAPPPELSMALRYHGDLLHESTMNMPILPEDELVTAPEWHAVGPWFIDELPSRIPPDPRSALPQLFLQRAPDRGFDSSAEYENEEGTTLRWTTIPALDAGLVPLDGLGGRDRFATAYAVCGVWSPADSRVFAAFRADDYGQIIVNGNEMDVYRTRRDAEPVALTLREGWNTAMVKVSNIEGGWSFSLRLFDPEGTLRFSATPGGAE